MSWAMRLGGAGLSLLVGCGGDDAGSNVGFGAPAPPPEQVSHLVTLDAFFYAADDADDVTVTVTSETDGDAVLVEESGWRSTWLLWPARRYRVEAAAPGYVSVTRYVTTGGGGTALTLAEGGSELGTPPIQLSKGIRLGRALVSQGFDPQTGTLIVSTDRACLRIHAAGAGPLEVTELAAGPAGPPRFSLDGTMAFMDTIGGLVGYDTATWTPLTGDLSLLDDNPPWPVPTTSPGLLVTGSGHTFESRTQSGGGACPEPFYQMTEEYPCLLTIDGQGYGVFRMSGVSPTVDSAVVIGGTALGGGYFYINRVDLGGATPVFTNIDTPAMGNRFSWAMAVRDLVLVQDQSITIDVDTGVQLAHAPAVHAIDIRTGAVMAVIPGSYTFHPRSDNSVVLVGGDRIGCPDEWYETGAGDCPRDIVVVSPDGDIVETVSTTQGIPFGLDRSQALTLDSYGHLAAGTVFEQPTWTLETSGTGARRIVAQYASGDTTPQMLGAPCLVYTHEGGVYCVR